ncbi:MAG: 2-hydroxyacyl-CoA dehydratase family protein [Clostridiales Family XIII bacterium]|jgi:benzoyl-CoA reductase/2-hydroxyglutaryl-CoA dehydratase subunit BcrC/BadD/HgdB|nr:2-hydroxyacyl-CoA dehydratase family protein [Clostridiales Family XIII bacterium]
MTDTVQQEAKRLAQLLIDVAADPKAALRAHLAGGRKVVGCFPVLTPDEVVHAAGMVPFGLWGGRKNAVESTKYLQAFCCSVMKANVENGMTGVYDGLTAVITTAYCDTLKCIEEVWKVAVPALPSIPFVCPQNRKDPAALDFLESAFARLAEALGAFGGRPVTEEALEKSIAVFGAYRAEARRFSLAAAQHPWTIPAAARHGVLKAAYFMRKEDYTEILAALNDALGQIPDEREGKTGVVLTGLMAEPNAFLELLPDYGFYVAADDLVHESLQFRADVPGPEAGGSAARRLAMRFVGVDGCSLLYDDEKRRGKRLIELCEAHGARAVIACMMKFCDPEEFDFPLYSKELAAAGIPLLPVEVEQNMAGAEGLRTRVQTFSEMLRFG